ncbi:MAG: WD40 repeat domain-containing protein [Muribaculaceae bacterium]|nr:WD40 repeat domain-containing protein [Muribaculaceae bacterium]
MKTKVYAFLALAALAVSLPADAKKKAEPVKSSGPKSEYSFKHKSTPIGLGVYDTTVYPYYGNEVSTLTGTILTKQSNPLTRVVFSPAGNTYTLVEIDKKGRTEAKVMATSTNDKEIKSLDRKHLGMPIEVGYTPDARNLILATERGIYLIDPRTFKPVRELKASITPAVMIMSPNSYFLTLTDGKNVEVINFEEGTQRKMFKYDEPVNEIFFSDDSSMLGILTADGILEIYDTRAFSLKQTIDELGQALSADFNFDGKYVAVATSPTTVEVINMLRDSERETIEAPDGVLTDVIFIPDSQRNTILTYTVNQGVKAKRMYGLEPYYGKLMADEVADRMNEWLKMMPGESMEEYRARVNDASRAAQQRLFEDEISTRLADNMLSMSSITLGKYDRANQLLEVDFSNMPSILLPVPETDLQAFTSGDDLSFTDAKYGILPNDNFELIYAKVYNKSNGQTYLFDNLERRPLSFMSDDDNVVSLELIQEQQLQEMKLEQLRREVVEQAKSHNVISDNTNITVDSRIIPDYNANGDRILNYEVKFSYEVTPEFSAVEDFGPGKYHVDESGAAQSMLKIVKEAFEGDFAKYMKPGKKLKANIYGTADATPIIRTIAYDGSYGDFEEEPVRQNGQLSTITVTAKDGIKENPQLAFLRAIGVQNYLVNNVSNLQQMNPDFNYNIDVSQDRGSEFRRITVTFTFVDAL